MNKKLIRNVFFGVLACIFFYWLLHETERVAHVWDFLKGVFKPFVFGGILAFILNVPMRAFDKLFRRIRSDVFRRTLSMIATILTILLVIIGVILLVIPQLTATVQKLLQELPPFFNGLEEKLNRFMENHPELLKWATENDILTNFNWSGLLERIADALGSSFNLIITGAINAVGSAATFVFHAVISIAFSLYCLARKETLARQGRRLLYALCKEERADYIVRVLRMTNSTFSNFLTGQCLDALIIGLLFVPAMAIFRMPYIPLICCVITVTALIPLVGAFAGCILGTFLIMVNDPYQAVIFVILFLVIQQFEENVIYPRVVGSSIGLPGMWVLLAVAVGGAFWGVIGMFLMVPFASVIYSLIREATHKRLAQKNIDPDKLVEHPPELQPHFRMKAQARKEKRQERREERVERREERKARKTDMNREDEE